METTPIRAKPFLEKRRIVLLRVQLLEHGSASTLFDLRIHIERVDGLLEHRDPARVCVCVSRIPRREGVSAVGQWSVSVAGRGEGG